MNDIKKKDVQQSLFYSEDELIDRNSSILSFNLVLNN